MSKQLANKTALVTGASRGIGRAIAKRLAADGAHVFVHYNSSSNEADKLIAEIEQAGGSAEPVAANLEDVDAVDGLVTDVKLKLGTRKLDILVNNAGILPPHVGDNERRHSTGCSRSTSARRIRSRPGWLTIWRATRASSSPARSRRRTRSRASPLTP